MGVICPEDFATLNSLADAIHEVVAAIRQTPENYSLIHNDLHTGNWLARGKRVIPIDFSLCAYGYHLFDIATSAGSLGAENPILRRLFIKGYRELHPLKEGYERALEAFFLTSVLGYYTFILPAPSQHEWLYERLPRMLRTFGQKFLRAEPFFFEG
jgi:Ser/Thr protein kinase RdoA (MazF antagonist)